MTKYRFILNLQTFSEEMGASDAGVDGAHAADVQGEGNDEPSGVEQPAAAEPKESNFEKAFAKRLAAKEAEWQAKIQEVESKYKDYDAYKETAEYFRELNQAPDIMSLKERIEMERLQQRAEEQGISPELQKRLEYLEARDRAAAELEKQMQEEQRQKEKHEQHQQAYQSFRSELDAFAKENNADADKLYEFMVENQVGRFDVALKAMQYEEMKAQLENAKKEGVKEFLAAKGSIPTVTGSTAQGQVVSLPPKTFAEARARAMQRSITRE